MIGKFNNLTKEELDLEYDNIRFTSKKVGNNLVTKEYIELYTKLSERINNSEYVYKRNISYGKNIMNKLDIYKPKKILEKNVLVIWIHGGYWGNVQISTKELNSFAVEGLLENGLYVISLEYPFNGEGAIKNKKLINNSGNNSIREIVSEIHKGIKYIMDNLLKELNIKGENIFLCGHSAGAHLASLEILNGNLITNSVLILEDTLAK